MKFKTIFSTGVLFSIINVCTAQTAQITEFESGIKRRYEALTSNFEKKTISTTISDYFPEYGFAPKWSAPINSVIILPETSEQLAVCINATPSIFQKKEFLNEMTKLGYVGAGSGCVGGYTSQLGASAEVWLKKQIDIGSVISPSTLPEGLNIVAYSLKQKTPTLIIPASETSKAVTVQSSQPIESFTCNTQPASLPGPIIAELTGICAAFSSAEKNSQPIEYSITYSLPAGANSFRKYTYSTCVALAQNSCELTIGFSPEALRPKNYNIRLGWDVLGRLKYKAEDYYISLGTAYSNVSIRLK